MVEQGAGYARPRARVLYQLFHLWSLQADFNHTLCLHLSVQNKTYKINAALAWALFTGQ